MTAPSPVFRQTREAYLAMIHDAAMDRVAAVLGFQRVPAGYSVRLLDRDYVVGEAEIRSADGRPAAFDVCVLLSRYVISCPAAPDHRPQWAAFRDFRDAGPLLVFFADTVEGAIARRFRGRAAALAAAAAGLGGRPEAGDLAYDLKIRFTALPRIDILMLFNDADEQFGPECRVLFQRHTESYLDMECVAILGARLAAALCRSTPDSR